MNSRNIAVRPGIDLEVRSPNMTTTPEAIAIRLMITCTVTNVDRLIPRIMTRSPFLSGAMLRLRNENFHPRATRGDNSWGDDQKRDSDVQVFCMAVTNRAGTVAAF